MLASILPITDEPDIPGVTCVGAMSCTQTEGVALGLPLLKYTQRQEVRDNRDSVLRQPISLSNSCLVRVYE